mgnify:FL=1
MLCYQHMNKIFVLKILVTSVFIFIAITFVFPLHYSFAQTSTSTPVFQDHSALIKQLQALIISLQAQISDLKAKLEITRTDLAEVKEEVRISRNLFLGISGDDVKQLQEVLKQDPEIYPEGLVTGFFGQKTAAAVKRFQEKHGIEAIGSVGPRTLAKVNELITRGAGKSGVIPPGLERRFGITTQEQIQSLPTPSGTIPAQPIGHTGTTTIPAVPAISSTTTASTTIPTTSSSPVPSVSTSPVPPPSNTPIPSPSPTSASPSSPSPSPSAVATTTTSTTDTTAPSSATNLTATQVNNWYAINLSWSASTDNIGVVGYKVYRNGAQIYSAATSSSLSTLRYCDCAWNNPPSTITFGTTYAYTVSAYDAAGNVSPQSSAASVTPMGETTASSSPSLSPSPSSSPAPSPASSPLASIGTVKWTHSDGGEVAIGQDGTIYMRSLYDSNSKLYALNPADGSEKWVFPYPSSAGRFAFPAIAGDGTIYTGSFSGSNNKLFAINSDGSQKWTFPLVGVVYGAPAIAADGTIYIGTGYNAKFYAINPDGTAKWNFTASTSVIYGSPSV